jgi:ferredoxin
LIARRGREGIGYIDETLEDRGPYGVLWARMTASDRLSEPLYGAVHPRRQREVMLRLGCQVCGRPASRTAQGYLFLLDDDGQQSLEGEITYEPPVCLSCVRRALNSCPRLRAGAIAVRAQRAFLWGISGTTYQLGADGLVPVDEADDAIVPFSGGDWRWVVGSVLLRELTDCTPVNVSDLLNP